MKPWGDFYDLIMPDLPGCPFVVVDNALRQSAISFCEQSLAWRWDHPDISIAAGTAAYALPRRQVLRCIALSMQRWMVRK